MITTRFGVVFIANIPAAVPGEYSYSDLDYWSQYCYLTVHEEISKKVAAGLAKSGAAGVERHLRNVNGVLQLRYTMTLEI